MMSDLKSYKHPTSAESSEGAKSCPVCGAAASLFHAIRDVPFVYRGRETLIAAVEGEHCDACGEVILGREAGDRYMALVGEFMEEVKRTQEPRKAT